MKKLASIPLDITDELLAGDAELIAGLVERLPDSIKTASIPSAQEQAELPDREVALILFHPHLGEMKKFAMNTPELCEVNMILLDEKKAQLPDELVKIAANNLGRTALRLGLDIPEGLRTHVGSRKCSPVVDLTGINKTAFYRKLKIAETMQKEASVAGLDDLAFALPAERKYPIHDESHIKLAISYFDQYYLDMEPENRLRFAINTAYAANREKVDYSSSHIDKYAHLSPYKYNDDVEHHINMRERYTSDETQKAACRSLAEKCRRIGVLKTASEIAKLDEEVGATRAYGHTLVDPLLAALGNSKVAMREVDDRIVTQDMINKALDGDGKDYVDSYTATELRGDEGIDVFASLPEPIRHNLYGYMD